MNWEGRKLNKVDFSFSDLLAGYVTKFEWSKDTFLIKTSDEREYEVKLTSTTYAELIRNLGEPYLDCTGQIKDMLAIGRYVFVYGIYYGEDNEHHFEAKHLVFLGRSEDEYRFETKDWWLTQIDQLAKFYLHSEFSDGKIDYRNYRTSLNLEGVKAESYRQETDTISRLVYGFASAYMLTGHEEYLEAAEKGTEYLRDHLRNFDEKENIVYWYHAIDVKGKRERKILASEFGDDYDAIPMYEQIYALAGPIQTYRITGDPRIKKDADRTINLFNKCYLDQEKGGYFSHIDPITLSARSASLGRNRSRKNWNSVGDHAPAYLINLYLATEEEEYANMLSNTADTIEAHFPDYEHSPFVQERFHEDWSHDKSWGWQENRAVVGHNLKIAWNLTRIYHLNKEDKYMKLANKIAEIVPKTGYDNQRSGWYDVVERELKSNEKIHRFVWHDRKAWWQQEQAILAYLILYGSTQKQKYMKYARESSAFYNAWFLDHDSNGIYFNVLANGLPYLMGTERLKGSHSMSGYHSFELAYLSTIYTNLLITKKPIDLYFKPYPGGFDNNILRVQPDLLPTGSICIKNVWINGEEYNNFDKKALTIQLPDMKEPVKVRVRIEPTNSTEYFSCHFNKKDDKTSEIYLIGNLDHSVISVFQSALDQVIDARSQRLVLFMKDLDVISSEAMRLLILAKQKMDVDFELIVVGAKENIKHVFEQDEFREDTTMVDTY